MFIAMNRSQVIPDGGKAFGMSRDWCHAGVPGLIEFHVLHGPTVDDHPLYSPHTMWLSRGGFKNRTRSEAFRVTHRDAGDQKSSYLASPRFDGFDVIRTVTPS